jgi:hypothetical protein
MEQNREHRNTPLCKWPNDFQQGAKTTQGERTDPSTNMLGKLDIHMQKMKLDPYHIPTLTQNGLNILK